MFLLTRPAIVLRLEGATALALATCLFWRTDGNWLLFAVGILAPDVGILGYLRGSRVGSTLYDLFHTYALPAALGAFGLVAESALAISLALIWGAHIGLDRFIGFGLTYAWAPFRETHLDKV